MSECCWPVSYANKLYYPKLTTMTTQCSSQIIPVLEPTSLSSMDQPHVATAPIVLVLVKVMDLFACSMLEG